MKSKIQTYREEVLKHTPKAEFKDKKLFEKVSKLYSKLNKEDLGTLMEWVSANCEVVEGNKCDECGTKLEKTYIMSKFDLPISCWVCPKGEIYQAYKSDFEKRYNKHK